jgi:pimeloyl-ACP methyl ester carboxylesterase
MEEATWPTSWLRRIGLDLAFFVLPAHGPRREPGRLGAPRFPGADPRITLELFRHTMGELTDLVAWLRAEGHPKVGIMGMSLGGYTTALAATVVRGLDFAIPIIPLVSIADFAREQGRLGSTPEETRLQHEALERAHALASPLARPSLLPGRVHVVAGEADRITPIAHAEKLARHFGAPLETWAGGHLFQLGRADAFRGIGRTLKGWGVI